MSLNKVQLIGNVGKDPDVIAWFVRVKAFNASYG